MFPISQLWYIIGHKISLGQRLLTEFICDVYITGQKKPKKQNKKTLKNCKQMSLDWLKHLFTFSVLACLPSKSRSIKKCFFGRWYVIEIKSRDKKRERYYVYFLYYILCGICSGKIEGITEIIWLRKKFCTAQNSHWCQWEICEWNKRWTWPCNVETAILPALGRAWLPTKRRCSLCGDYTAG